MPTRRSPPSEMKLVAMCRRCSNVEYMIVQDSRSARTSLAILDSALRTVRRPASLLYIGTPSGLAGLIADIDTLGIADGVMVRPLVVPGVLSCILDDAR
jgi:arginine repressor